uniref:DUF2088 domain-containing protein n=1 Tax=Panagrellus redivivus TaxID=6233 RepID=A0A7E4UUW8_PANRE
MKTKKLRRVRLTIKQHNLWKFEASLTILDRQDVIESGMAGLNLSETPKVPPKTETVPTPPTAAPFVKASITLTSDNRILIQAGPKFTGDAEIPGYFRLEQAAGDPRIQLGVEAKKALKKHPKTVIYDIPGILAAASKPTLVKSSWTFETSRDAADNLLIHLGNDVKTTPVALFGTVIQNVYTYIKANLDGDIESITIHLPEGSSILASDLTKLSDKIGVPVLTA